MRAMKSAQIERKFIDFFVANDHQEVGQISLVPQEDPTLLFTSAGMVQFKPYFLGLEEPPARRLVNVQRCLRTTDIEKVGRNARTLSFFEMLGSWSIGDYFKEEAIRLAWRFLTEELNFSSERLWATYFAGEEGFSIPADKESRRVWEKVGLPAEHIVGLGREENFWQAAAVGPCGPSTEVYLDRGESYGCGQKECRPGCDCDRFLEIWNAGVFMQYDQKEDGTFTSLPLKSVDTGAGLERLAMILQEKNSIFQIDLLAPLVEKSCSLFSVRWGEDKKIDQWLGRWVDHTRAVVFLVADGVKPANTEEGYVLRRLIRRAAYTGSQLDPSVALSSMVGEVIAVYCNRYSYLGDQEEIVKEIITKEEKRFRQALRRGRKQINKIIAQDDKNVLSGERAFHINETYGVPPEITKEEFRQAGYRLSDDFTQEYQGALEKHRAASRAEGKFTGGLADQSETVTKLHTATHLLQTALREILGEHVRQVGSNINKERLRFDFTNPRALTEEELAAVEKRVNEVIEQDLPVEKETMSLSQAEESGALAFFQSRYNENNVKVYQIGDFSREVCGGPHVERTGQLGRFYIKKEQSVGAGKRRIYAGLE